MPMVVMVFEFQIYWKSLLVRLVRDSPFLDYEIIPNVLAFFYPRPNHQATVFSGNPLISSNIPIFFHSLTMLNPHK